MLNRSFLLLFALVLAPLAACTDSSTPPPDDATMALGERIYRTNCNTCHQGEGQGMPGVFPPLTETEWVTGDKGRLIRLTLNGLNGPMTVNGVEYNSVMTPHDFLSDDQIAAVLTYIRQSFGNQASAVTPAEVAAVRAANTHEGMWDATTLENETGIPE